MDGNNQYAADHVEFEQGTAGSDDGSFDQEKAEQGVRLLLEAIGEDPSRDKLVETWQRRLPATLETLTEGYREDAKPVMRSFSSESQSLVLKTGIPVYSLCEHHLLPYFGNAHIGYRPSGEVVGLSKLTRYVRWQSRRLTMQEQLTQDLADGLATELDADIVCVELSATHLCEAMRGVETETETRTFARVGQPTENELERFRDAIEHREVA